MSTVSEIYPPREKVLIVEGKDLSYIPYSSINQGEYYCIPLFSGSYSVYRKTNLFDDELMEKVKTSGEAIELLGKLSVK